MKKNIALTLFAILLVSCGASVRISMAQGMGALGPVFAASEQAAALHKDLENRTKALSSKASVLAQRAAGYQPALLNYEVNDVKDGAGRLPDVIKGIGSNMSTMIYQMRRTGLFAAFYGKYKIWSAEFAKVKSIEANLQASMQPLDTIPSDPKQAAQLLQKPAEYLEELSGSARQLHTDFQVMGNILEIFQQIPATLVTAPSGRVMGETWLQHEERTGYWGIADPMRPTRNFGAHSIYAIRDHNRGHVVWAEEANILDFLVGRVKGQDYAYKNSADVPYCNRCHNPREGKHNFTWCRPTNSKTMIDACNVLEKTAH